MMFHGSNRCCGGRGKPAGDLVGLHGAEAQTSLILCNGSWFSFPECQEKGIEALLIAWLGFLFFLFHPVPLEPSDRNLTTTEDTGLQGWSHSDSSKPGPSEPIHHFRISYP